MHGSIIPYSMTVGNQMPEWYCFHDMACTAWSYHWIFFYSEQQNSDTHHDCKYHSRDNAEQSWEVAE